MATPAAAKTETPPRIVRSRESLRHEFSDVETLELSRELARSHQEQAHLEEGKEKVVADFKAQITAKAGIISDLSRRMPLLEHAIAKVAEQINASAVDGGGVTVTAEVSKPRARGAGK